MNPKTKAVCPVYTDAAHMPDAVAEVQRWSQNKEITLHFTQNETAGSCTDACRKRMRRGEKGIPLGDELKSLVCSCETKDRQQMLVAVHCRANNRVHFGKLRRLVRDIMGGKPNITLMEPDMLQKKFRLRFGEVNPVLLETRSQQSLLQVFDAGLLRREDTLMTNAGVRTWGIEFDPVAMIFSLQNCVVSPVVHKEECVECLENA